MHRIAALLLCSSLAAVVWAAPAPVYKPDRTRWLGMDGWDAPLDRHRDCRFGRDRDKLVGELFGLLARDLAQRVDVVRQSVMPSVEVHHRAGLETIIGGRGHGRAFKGAGEQSKLALQS